MGKRVRIGVFGHYGHLNLGDEAIIVALLENIRRRRPDAELCAFSDNPEDTRCRHGVPAFPIDRTTFVPGVSDVPPAEGHAAGSLDGGGLKARLKEIGPLVRVVRAARGLIATMRAIWAEAKFVPTALRSLRDVDLFIVAGSNQFLDNWGGPWGFPYRVLRWSILARLSGAKLAFMSVGAGPIDRLLSRILARTALLFSHYTSFRDDASRRLIESRGFRRGGAVYPDLAHSLSVADMRGTGTAPGTLRRRPTVGINPMPMFHGFYWCYPDEAKYQRYVERLAMFSARLIREGYPVFFFGTQKDDEETFHDVHKRLREELGESATPDRLYRRCEHVSELMAALASADFVVTTRFHGTVLALLAERPVLAICYYRKARDLMREMGQTDYAIEFEDFDVDDAWRRFEILEQNRLVEQEKIRKRNVEYREALDRQYEYVLGRLLPSVQQLS
jgi:polysaccharide pyruvyl transferase WcaK-like protein